RYRNLSSGKNAEPFEPKPSSAGRLFVAYHRAARARTSLAHKATEFVGRTWQAARPPLAVLRQRARVILCPTSRHRCHAQSRGRADPIPARGRDRCRLPSRGGVPVVTKRRDCRERLAVTSRLRRVPVFGPAALERVPFLVAATIPARLQPFSQMLWPAPSSPHLPPPSRPLLRRPARRLPSFLRRPAFLLARRSWRACLGRRARIH